MEGYARLASLMGAYPEVAIFRRFGALNTQNLLYLQAELIALEKDLRACAAEDNISGVPDRALDWYTLSHPVGDSSGSEGSEKEWQIILSIREKLKEYNETLFYQTTLTALHKPNHRDLCFLQQWMRRSDMGGVYLIGQDSDTWSDPDWSDLIALQARHADDPFTTWMTDKAVHWWHRLVGRYLREPDSNQHSGSTVSYSQVGLSRVTSLVGILLASLLPTAAIVVLYLIKSDILRLITIGIFTATFSVSLKMVTNARLVDIFAATAAFTAVQVVFVGNNGNINSNLR